MNEMAIEAITQWGMAGIALVAAGYVIWNTHKEERKNKERYEEKLLELSTKRSTRDSIAELDQTTKESISRIENNTKKVVDKIDKKIDELFCSQDACKVKLGNIEHKVNELDTTVNNIINAAKHTETERYTNIIRVAPTLNTICTNNMEEMKVDHIFVALLHNGQTGITGIPFIKQSVIVEKYDPIKNIKDINYTQAFKDDELTRHDKLPAAILQNDLVDITVDETGFSKMNELDVSSAQEMTKIGTKRIIFKAIKDERGVPMGYICAYSYLTRDIDLQLFEETAETIERVYRDVCA